MLELKKALKSRGKTKKWLAQQLGVTPAAINARQKNPTYDSIKEIANAIGCEVHELFETSEAYAHWYDPNTGEWLGVRKK